MFSIITSTVKQRKAFVAWWSIGIISYIILSLAFYPAFRDQAAELNKAIAQIPDSVKSFLADSTDYASPIGFMSSKLFYLFEPLLFAGVAIALGCTLIAREEREGTIELLL